MLFGRDWAYEFRSRALGAARRTDADCSSVRQRVLGRECGAANRVRRAARMHAEPRRLNQCHKLNSQFSSAGSPVGSAARMLIVAMLFRSMRSAVAHRLAATKLDCNTNSVRTSSSIVYHRNGTHRRTTVSATMQPRYPMHTLGEHTRPFRHGAVYHTR